MFPGRTVAGKLHPCFNHPRMNSALCNDRENGDALHRDVWGKKKNTIDTLCTDSV